MRPVASTITTLTQAGARATTPRAGTIMVQRQKSPVAQQTVRIVQQGQQGTTQVINLGSAANIISGARTITVSINSECCITGRMSDAVYGSIHIRREKNKKANVNVFTFSCLSNELKV